MGDRDAILALLRGLCSGRVTEWTDDARERVQKVADSLDAFVVTDGLGYRPLYLVNPRVAGRIEVPSLALLGLPCGCMACQLADRVMANDRS